MSLQASKYIKKSITSELATASGYCEELSDVDINKFLEDIIFDGNSTENQYFSHHDTLVSPSKRKYDATYDWDYESDQPTNLDSSLSTDHQNEHTCDLNQSVPREIVCVSTLPVYKKSEFVVNALNGSNAQQYATIVKNIINPSCNFIIHSPGVSVSRHGMNIGTELMKATLETFANIDSKITRKFCVRKDNLLRIVSHTRIQGTRVNGKHFNRFFGVPDDALLSDYMLDPMKTSTKQMQKIKSTEELAKDCGRNVDVFIKFMAIDECDLVLQCVKRHWSKVRVSSIRLTSIHT